MDELYHLSRNHSTLVEPGEFDVGDDQEASDKELNHLREKMTSIDSMKPMYA